MITIQAPGGVVMTIESQVYAIQRLEIGVHVAQEILAKAGTPWRWFLDEDWIVLEPPQGVITAEVMRALSQRSGIKDVQAVFRPTPKPGIYLRLHYQ